MSKTCHIHQTELVIVNQGGKDRWHCPQCFRERGNRYHDNTKVAKAAKGGEAQSSSDGPWLQDDDLILYQGDAVEQLCQLSDGSVDMVATSPPFYGLRDYGVDGQIGLEKTPEQWAARLVSVFQEVRRILRDEGTFWIEVGDTWVDKELIGAPWILSFALSNDGWKRRQEIIWEKPNAMPESTTDRPTRSHSTIFLFSKQPSYFYDADVLREPYIMDGRRITTVTGGSGSEQHRNGERWPNPNGANARSVWTIPTEPTPFAHFATWPQALVKRMILAGCPEGGTVLDPFAGSGTTLLAARALGRRSIGVELSEEYCKLISTRTQQLSLLT